MSEHRRERVVCAICGKDEHQCHLIQGVAGYVCTECIEGVHSFLLAQQESVATPVMHGIEAKELLPPREMKAFLDRYVIGQDRAKRFLSVAVFNQRAAGGAHGHREDSPCTHDSPDAEGAFLHCGCHRAH